MTPEKDDFLFFAVNLDPHNGAGRAISRCRLGVRTSRRGVDRVEDLVTGKRSPGTARSAYVARPAGAALAIWRLNPPGRRADERSDSARAAGRSRRGDGGGAHEPARRRHRSHAARLVQGRRHLSAARQGVLRRQRRRHRRFRGADAAARLYRGPRRHRDLAAAVLSFAAARRRLRHRRLPHINPSYGNMRDFRRFVREAHRRGIRVITELVINHTSDQHPWFQRARKAPPGSRRARLLCVERHRPALPGHAHHLPRHREIELDLGPGGAGLFLAPLLFAPAGPQLRQPAGVARKSSS